MGWAERRRPYLQELPWQVDGDTHVVPQVPQLFAFVVVSTQFPPQFVYGAAQAHVPPEQVKFPPQLSWQKPQLVLSVFRLTQLPLHSVSPGEH
jgi:hypothetical protein